MAVATPQLAPAVRTFTRGRSNALEVTFTDAAGAPVDDAGASYRLTARTGYDAPGVSFTRTATQSAPGKATIIIQPTDTSALPAPTVYVYEVDVLETGGRRTAVEEGRIILRPEVSA